MISIIAWQLSCMILKFKYCFPFPSCCLPVKKYQKKQTNSFKFHEINACAPRLTWTLWQTATHNNDWATAVFKIFKGCSVDTWSGMAWLDCNTSKWPLLYLPISLIKTSMQTYWKDFQHSPRNHIKWNLIKANWLTQTGTTFWTSNHNPT